MRNICGVSLWISSQRVQIGEHEANDPIPGSLPFVVLSHNALLRF